MRIGVGGVDQVYSGIQRRVHDVDALLLVAIAIGAEHHGSESVCAHADTGSSERAIFHVLSSVGLRLALAHLSAVCENYRLPAMRPPPLTRRATATREQDRFPFAQSEAAISRRS